MSTSPVYITYPGLDMQGATFIKNQSPNDVMDRKVFDGNANMDMKKINHHRRNHLSPEYKFANGRASSSSSARTGNFAGGSTSVMSAQSSVRGSTSVMSTQRSIVSRKGGGNGNSSVQVAVRIRPLLDIENDQECVHISGYTESDDNDHDHPIIRQNSSGESTITTVPGGFSESQHTDHEHGYEHDHGQKGTYRTVQIGKMKGGEGENGLPLPSYTFDHVFPSQSGQRHIYHQCISPLVTSCLEGYNATVLAYGQTGSGKTHTILGNIDDIFEDDDNCDEVSSNGSGRDNDANAPMKLDEEGVIPRALKGLFHGLEEHQRQLQQQSSQEPSQTNNQMPFEYSVKIQFLELYGEEIRDLLTTSMTYTDEQQHQLQRRPLSKAHSYHPVRKVRGGRSTPMPTSSSSSLASFSSKIYIRDGSAGEDAEVVGAQRVQVQSAYEALRYMKRGLTKRVVGKTAMNAHSSRSHAIFTVVVQQTMRSANHKESEKTHVEMKTSKIHFVDLCGSERMKRAKTEGIRMKEGIDINKGLLVLGNVISALGGGNKDGRNVHVPYRDSKLTRLLKGSLGGNHKTLMIACISPSLSNANESTNTLRYANRAKNIQNHAKVNVDPASRVVNELRGQVAALAAELLRVRNADQTEDCPFSIEFLKDLMMSGASLSGSSLKSWRRKMIHTPLPTVIDNGSNDEEEEELPPNEKIEQEIRPSTCPVETKVEHQISWHLEDNDLEMETDSIPDDDSAEDPDLEKDIVSYDFALSTLRQTLITQNESSRRLSYSSSDDYDSGVEAVGDMEEDDYAPMPKCDLISAPESSLREIRNIDELYDFLNKNTYVNEEGDVVDEDGTVVSEVVNNHVAKLDGVISQNEILLREMMSCQELFEAMKEDNNNKLSEIEDVLLRYNAEVKRFEEEMSLHPRDSQGFRHLHRSIEEKKNKMSVLEEEKRELQKMNKTSDDNKRNLLQLKTSIAVMKRQRSNLSEICSRPPSRGPSESINANDYQTEGSLVTPDHSPTLSQRCLHSERTVPRNNRANRIDEVPAEDDSSDSSSITIPNVLRLESLNEHEESFDPKDNSSTSHSQAVMGDRIPPNDQHIGVEINPFGAPYIGSSWSDSEMATPHGSKVRKPVSPKNKQNIFDDIFKTQHDVPEKRQRAAHPDKNEQRFKQSFHTLSQKDKARKYEYQSPEPIAYRRMYEREQRMKHLAGPTYSRPYTRSVFDVIDESTKPMGTTKVYELGLTIAPTTSDLTEPDDLCPAGFFVNAFRKIFSLRNPALKSWEA